MIIQSNLAIYVNKNHSHATISEKKSTDSALAGDVFQGVLACKHAAGNLFAHAESQLKIDYRGKRKHYNRREKDKTLYITFFKILNVKSIIISNLI
jgi:hypothetical protein